MPSPRVTPAPSPRPSASPSPTSSPSRSPLPGPSPSGGFPTVAAAAVATPELSTLVDVASAVGLAQALADPNLVATVLAPTNAAFASLLQRLNLTSDQLIANESLVRLVLSYHLIPGQALTAAQLSNGQTLQTGDQGETLTVVKSAGGVEFDPTGPGAPNARVVQADIAAGKAVVHVIDQVLIPANANLALPAAPAGGGGGNATAAAAAGAATGTGTTEVPPLNETNPAFGAPGIGAVLPVGANIGPATQGTVTPTNGGQTVTAGVPTPQLPGGGR